MRFLEKMSVFAEIEKEIDIIRNKVRQLLKKSGNNTAFTR